LIQWHEVRFGWPKAIRGSECAQGASMIDKPRHSRPHAPRGTLPNWVLAVFMVVAIVAVASISRVVV
jgi:hypothetical protein